MKMLQGINVALLIFRIFCDWLTGGDVVALRSDRLRECYTLVGDKIILEVKM